MEEEKVIPITDTRLENALNAYVFILRNTLSTFCDAGLNLSDDIDSDEVVKAAANIAFKYMSMETEIAMAKENQK